MTTRQPSSSEVRAWARSAGLEVGDRGRLSPAVLAAYDQAHGGARVNAAAAKAPAKKSPAKKAPGNKAPGNKAPGNRAPAKRAPAKSARTAPVRRAAVAHETPAEPASTVAAAPALAADSELLRSLQEQVHLLSSRVESLEAARAAEAKQAQTAVPPRRGLFGKRG